MKKVSFLIIFLLLVNVASAENVSVVLHGEKTDVILGEDIILKLSAVNIIKKPVEVQVILIPPSGMSVISSQFVTSGGGQFTSTFKLNGGDGKDIEVRIKTAQVGDFEVKGLIIETSTNKNYSLSLPITVKPPPIPTETPTPEYLKTSTNPYIFIGFVFLIGVFFVISNIIRKKDNEAGIKDVNEIRNIIGYFIILIIIAYGLTDLFRDTRDLGYISTISDISQNFKDVWFSLLTFCFGAFYGIAIIVAWFDWKKRFQSVSILVASLIVTANFFHIITLRPWIFIIGLIAFGYLTHSFKDKEGEYIKYQVSPIAIISIIAAWLALFNYLFGKYDADRFIFYLILVIVFSYVFYKFSIYEISNLKLFIVGPKRAGKTVFVSLLYEEAFEQKRTINVSTNLSKPLGILREGNWPPASISVTPYDFRYIHGNLFAKEVNIDIDYSGEMFEKNFNAIIEYIGKKNDKIDGDVKTIAEGIYNANKLIFIIDADNSDDYIQKYYLQILKEMPNKTCYLLITKSDKLYGDKQIDTNYNKFKKYVLSQIETKNTFYKDIKIKAKAILPVYVYEKDDKKPDIKKAFGFDKVLDYIGK